MRLSRSKRCMKTLLLYLTVFTLLVLVSLMVLYIFCDTFPLRIGGAERFLSNDFQPFPPLTSLDAVGNGSFNIVKKVNLVWIGTKALRPVGLATIDSITRYMPSWEIEIHFTGEKFEFVADWRSIIMSAFLCTFMLEL